MERSDATWGTVANIARPALLAASLWMFTALAHAQTIVHEIRGDGTNDYLGFPVSGAGDLNADGYLDVIAGAVGDQTGSNRGSVRAYSGSDALQIYSWHGDLQWSQFSDTIGPAGDVNGDGYPDVIVGARDSASGRAYVFSGADGSLLHLLEGDATGDSFYRAAGIGDVNGDGYADLAVGGPTNSANGGHSGIVKIFSGRDGNVLHVLHGLPGERFGSSVSGIGDVNGDGFGDLIVGARMANTSNGLTSGKVVVFSGFTGSPLYSSIGSMEGALFGFSCAGGGDVNLDGIPDSIVGAPNDGSGPPWPPIPGPGSARVLSGPNGTTLYEWSGATPTFRLGVQVAMLGDVDGDGHADLGVVAEFRTDGSSLKDNFVYSGRDGSILYDLGTASLGFTLGTLGWVGDLNRDGYADIAAGMTGGGDNAGTVFVFSGFEHLLGFCAGDGSGAACPCGNTGAPGRGCANSGGAGALLSASGSASLADDEFRFQGAGLLPGQAALLFSANNALNGGQGIPLGDGLRCAGGGLRRLGVRVPDGAGDASWGPGLSVQGAWSPGDLRRFQVWYRDPAPLSPCGTSFNTTNGIEIVFSL